MTRAKEWTAPRFEARYRVAMDGRAVLKKKAICHQIMNCTIPLMQNLAQDA